MNLSRGGEPPGKPAVLVVDNDAGTLVALGALLDQLDCRVVYARSGAEAVERARAEDFAAIVMDVRMSDLDGYAAASFIRQHTRSASTPILFFSGEDLDVAKLTRQYGHAGQVDSLQKPFDPEVFRAKIRGWLDLNRQEHHIRELEHVVDAAMSQARTKDDVLAMVAHDLRGPLGAIKFSVSAVRQHMAAGEQPSNKFTESVRRHLDLADRTVDGMAGMVSDLVDSVRMETGLQLDRATHPVTSILEQAIELLSPLAEQKKVAVSMNLRGPACVISCDRDRILQVLSNLLGNAVKFTPPGGKVQIETTCSEGGVEVCVTDTGPGIAADQLPHIFDKYWQGQTRANHKGLGLGLAIVREIVQAHGGRVWVDSHVGEGSRFFFSLPRAS